VREQDEDAAWRAIVENFGERARLDDEPPEASPHAEGPAAVPDAPPDDLPDDLVDEPPYSPTLDAPEERFRPPPPPPLPAPRGPRALAWLGVLGAPLVVLGCVLATVTPPAYVTWLLVGGFLGGFAYLVAIMPRGPREPWDDGAQV